MSFTALLVSALIDLASTNPAMMACTFPPAHADGAPISVEVESLPSLKDRTGYFRIRMHVRDEGRFPGLAQPLEKTGDRDVLIHARTRGNLFYSIGLRDDGQATLNLLALREAEAPERREARAGTCSDFERYIDDWLRS